MLMPLNKYVAQCGIASRRKVIEFIKAGDVTVDGVVITEPGFKVDSTSAQVRYQGKLITPIKHVYVLLNKPKDYITTLSDQSNRKTVIELVRDATAKRIFPVGRLDRNTTGLLLFTNDGLLAQQLTHPKFGVKKTYHVTLDKPLKAHDLAQLKKGLVLDDGPIEVDRIWHEPNKPKNEVLVELHSGRYRIVRRMFAFLGYNVIKLDRINYAGLSKKGLKLGQWRFLADDEVLRLASLAQDGNKPLSSLRASAGKE